MADYITSKIEDIWNHFKLDISKMRESFPGRRRSEVMCPITGKMTRNLTGVDDEAWNLLNKGILFEEYEKKNNAGKRWYAFEYSDLPHWRDYANNHSSHAIREFELIFKIADIKMYNNSSFGPLKGWDGESWLFEPPERRNWDFVKYVFLSDEQYALLKEMWGSIVEAFDRCAKANSESGSSFMVELARGNKSLEDYNRYTLRLNEDE